MTHSHTRKLTVWQYGLLVVCIILTTTIQFTTYSDHNYRQDEINTIHAAHIMSPSEITAWMATNIHPPAWRLLADTWVDMFGNAEPVTRWSSVLANLLTFALLFRLGADLLDWRLGLLAVFLLGVYPTVVTFLNELRPYPYLILLVTASHLLFLRWIRVKTFRYMFGYVLVGILALYTHYYAIYILPAHLLFLLVTIRWRPAFYLRTISMWVFIGLAFSGWLIPFVHGFTVRQSGGIYYALPNQVAGLQLLYDRLKFMPEAIGQLLFLTGIITPLFYTFKPSEGITQRWRKYHAILYPLILLLSMLILAWGANMIIRNVTARNMTILLPSVVLLMALGLRALPKPVHILTVIILLFGIQHHLSTNSSNGPYREIVQAMAQTYQPDSILITEFETAWQWLMPTAYTLMDFAPINMDKSQMLHLLDRDDRAHSPGPPDYLTNIYKTIDTEQLNQFVGNQTQLWVLQEGVGNDHHDTLNKWLKDNYTKIQESTWHEGYPTTYTLTEYAQVPDSANLMLVADDILEMHYWHLKDSVAVTPCQTITVENWWQTDSATDNPLQVQLILADDNGQVAISEEFPSSTFTTDWEPDTYYRDLTSLIIPCDISAGNYNLLLGIKDSITGEQLPLADPDGSITRDLFYLTTLNTQRNE